MADPALKRDPSLNYKPRLVLFDRVMLKVGRWNGNVYPLEEIKPLINYLNNPPKTPEARNATSLFVGAAEDHQDSTGTWVGKAKGWYFDEKEQALKCKRLEFVQQATAEALAYQLDNGQAVFGISPRLEVRRDGDVCRDIIVKSWGVVLNPAGGEDLFLSKDAPLDDKDTSRTIMSLFMDISKGQFLKGEQHMTNEELQALVKKLSTELDELKGNGEKKIEQNALSSDDIKNIVADAVKTALDQKAEAEAEARKKAEEEKMAAKLEAIEAHLKGEEHDKSVCPLCIAEAKKLAEDEGGKKEDEEEMKEEKEDEEEMKEEKEDEEEMKKGSYPYAENRLGMVPFLPRQFKVASLEAKSLSRFGEDLVEVIKPIFEKETLTADELQKVVSNIDKLLLQVPHDGPDPKVVAKYEAAKLAEVKAVKVEAEKMAQEIAKKEIAKLSKTPGRRGIIPEFVKTEEAPKSDFVNPSEKLGTILGRSLTR